jgi:hypothetical protein
MGRVRHCISAGHVFYNSITANSGKDSPLNDIAAAEAIDSYNARTHSGCGIHH